jgi:siroheme synthase (precorrin-2 oxidase/ferrochelatase)
LHVEDAPALTDSHAPAVLRRGALTIAVTTDGTAPAVAAELRDFLSGAIGPEWRSRLDQIAALRREWRNAGADHATVRRLTAAQIGRYGWPKLAANDRGAKTKEPTGGGLS